MSLEGPASPPALISVTHESVASGERRQKGGYGCRCGQTVMDDVAVGEERDRVEELCGAAVSRMSLAMAMPGIFWKIERKSAGRDDVPKILDWGWWMESTMVRPFCTAQPSAQTPWLAGERKRACARSRKAQAKYTSKRHQREALEDAENIHGRGGVETRRGLVEEEHAARRPP